MLFFNRFVDKDVNIMSYLRPSGFVYTRNKNVKTSTWLFALKPCLEVYGDDPELAKYFQDSYTELYATSGWYCFPANSDIIIENDTWISSVGQSTGMSIVYCHWNDSTDENCERDQSTLDLFESQTMVESKFVTKYFNPQTYKDKNGAMEYRVSANYN